MSEIRVFAPLIALITLHMIYIKDFYYSKNTLCLPFYFRWPSLSNNTHEFFGKSYGEITWSV